MRSASKTRGISFLRKTDTTPHTCTESFDNPISRAASTKKETNSGSARAQGSTPSTDKSKTRSGW